jgi:hypothetical protein
MDIPLAFINIHITIKTCSEGISWITAPTEVSGIIHIAFVVVKGRTKMTTDALIYEFMQRFRLQKQNVRRML